MAVTPNTVLYLLKSPIELDNLNQLTFSTEEAQHNYFLSLPRIEVDNISYQRKDNTIRFPAHIDLILEYNYVMYQNSNYSNKWFYAYITHMEYLNDGMTIITIDTDVYQTWMFDITLKQSFVVREHTNNDAIGANVAEEGLGTGEFVITTSHPFSYLRDTVNTGDDIPNESVLVIGVTRDPRYSDFPKIFGEDMRGTYSGVKYFAVENAESMNALLQTYAWAGYIEDVVSIFIAPIALVLTQQVWESYSWKTGVYYSILPASSLAPSYFRTQYLRFNFPTTLDGYTPRNKKLFTKEFSYVYATNYCGSSTQYFYEYFNNDLNLANNYCQFNLRGVLTPGCSIEVIPNNYQHTGGSEYNAATFTLPAPKLPLCNWNSDQFTNWLAQNGVNHALQRVEAAGSVVAGVGASVAASTGAETGGAGAVVGAGIAGAGLIMSGVSKTIRYFQEHSVHSYAPNSNSGSLGNSDSNYGSSRCFGFYCMSVSSNYARRLDKLFDISGYKTNAIKVPNVTGRRNWNYVQTEDVKIQATIPQEDLQKIKNMFNTGVTFWHDPATFLDYSQNNDII